MTRTLVAALLTLGDPNTLSGGYLFHRRLADLAPEADARLAFASFPHRPFPLAFLDAPRVFRLPQVLAADVLVLDSIAAAFAGPWLARRPPPAPLVGMLHQPPGGIDYGPPRSTLQAALDRLAYRRAERLLIASQALAEEMVAGGERRERLFVVPPGRDVAAASGPPPADLRHGRAVSLLCVGNWVERKGLHWLLEALSRLPEPLATLHLVGNDDAEPAYAARLRRRLATPGLRGRVVVHGPLDTSQVAAMYAAADVFVLPSVKEPYGTVYGEAMAFGLPVVGWRAGNLPYLAEHEHEGLIVSTGDVAGLAESLRRLAEDPDLRQRLGQAARARAEARPTWREVAHVFFDHLRQVRAAGVVAEPPL
jgi:glycosyltransferase involved in cell wall biosynthesis